MTTLGLTADQLLSTTRAVRKRLDFDRPVSKELIEECLEFTVQAPTGSNQQGWRFLVVTDDDKKAALADLYRKGWDMYTGGASVNDAPTPSNDPAKQQLRVVKSASYLAENFHRVPAMVLPCLPGPHGRWVLYDVGLHAGFHHPQRLVIHAGRSRTKPRHLLDHHPPVV